MKYAIIIIIIVASCSSSKWRSIPPYSISKHFHPLNFGRPQVFANNHHHQHCHHHYLFHHHHHHQLSSAICKKNLVEDGSSTICIGRILLGWVRKALSLRSFEACELVLVDDNEGFWTSSRITRSSSSSIISSSTAGLSRASKYQQQQH